MGADEVKTGGRHGSFNLLGGVAEVAGGFNLLIAEGSDLFEGAFIVFREQIANGVELEADGEAEGGCHESAAAEKSGAIDKRGGGGLEEVSSRGLMHRLASVVEWRRLGCASIGIDH